VKILLRVGRRRSQHGGVLRDEMGNYSEDLYDSKMEIGTLKAFLALGKTGKTHSHIGMVEIMFRA